MEIMCNQTGLVSQCSSKGTRILIPQELKWAMLVAFIIFSSYRLTGQTQTLYSYQSGSWSNPDVWTTDPGGTTLVGSRIPGNGDTIIILPSRTVVLRNGNVAASGLDITIQGAGILDDSVYTFTSALNALRGQGTLKLRTTNFPSATINTFVQAGGGTVEYNNTSNFVLPAITYNNLTLNFPGVTATQKGNITLNGNLTVQNGTFNINDGTATRLSLIIHGDVTVNTGASIGVGTGNTTTTTDPTAVGTGGTAPFLDYYVAQAHRVEIFGDFMNNGTVRFTNQNYPTYNAFPTNGIASVFFEGSQNNTLTCNGKTDFYNLILDKGTDATYVLDVNSAGYDKFRIFGANNASEFASADPDNPNIRKALWVRNGTIQLNGFIVIPSLTEGNGDFYIPSNAALVIDGPDVVVINTLDDYRELNAAYNTSSWVNSNATAGIESASSGSLTSCSFSVLGKFQINDGYFSTRECSGIVYWGTNSAQVIVNGGVIDTKQFRTANSSGGLTAYMQTGGTLELRGRFQRNPGTTDVNSLRTGTLNTTRVSIGPNGAVGTLDIDRDDNVFSMSGGTINIYDVCGTTAPTRAIEINSLPSNVNVTGGTINIIMTSGTNLADANYGIASKAPIYNLSITRNSGTQSATLLTIPAKTGVTAVTNPPLTVLNNLTLSDATASANAILDASTNNYDVYVGGNFNVQANATYNPQSNHTILNGTGSQTFTNSGTITSGLYRFFIDKNSGTATLGSNITVRDSLAIWSGTLNDGGYTLYVAGNIYNAGTHTGTGKIQLNGGGAGFQTLTASVTGNPTLGNLEINSTTSNTIAAQLGSDFAVTGLTMTSNKIFNIGTNRLTVGSNGITAAAFSTSRMIQVAGNPSDGGLRRYVNASSLTSGQSLLFPIGLTGNYTPCTINGNTAPGTGTGYVSVVCVNSAHPANNGTGQVLQYYWLTKATGLPTTSNTYYSFYNNVTPWNGNRAFVLLTGSTGWIEGGANTANSPNINLDGVSNGFISAAITAGNHGGFHNINAYYSIASGSWTNTAVWSTVDHTGASPCNCIPSTSGADLVYIGGVSGRNDSITLPAGAAGSLHVATITIEGSKTGNDRRPTLNLQGNGATLTVNQIAGAGKLATSGTTFYNGTCDMGALFDNDSALIQYFGTSITTLPTLPSPVTSYPNLLITGGNTKILPTGNTIVRKDLFITDPGNANNNLQLNGTSGDLSVYGDVKFQNGGKLIVPVSATARNINLYGAINFQYGNTNNNNAIQANSGAGTTHKLNFYGDTIYSGASSLTFNPANTNKIDLYFRNPGRVVVTNGTGTFSLNRMFMQKDVLTDTVYFKKDFSLNETNNNTANKSLNLGTGTLILSDAANGSASTINLNLSSGGTNYFPINSTSALLLRNGAKVNISGNTAGSGIYLDGLLQAEDASQINLADGTAGNTGYIEYSGSGNATINLFGSSALKASQVRRSTTLTTGVLKYTQSGSSTATLYGVGANATRARFEVVGSGSAFNMSGTSALSVITGGGTTFGDFYVRPASSSISGGTIAFGTGSAGQTFNMDATVPLNNLTLYTTGAANTLNLMVNPLVLNGTLTLNDANSTFISNNINVSIKGNFTNNGVYTPGTNNTTFNGNVQTLGGTSTTSFYNLIVNPATSLSLMHDVLVTNNLSANTGTLISSSYTIEVRGNVANNAAITNNASPAVNRLYMHGTALQSISGTGSFGRIELDNAAGVKLLSNISLSEDLTMTKGILNINQYLLTLGQNSEILGSGFGTSKMITSDGVISNVGIKKYFAASDTGFIYPLGVAGKYTPAWLSISATNAGYVRINNINSRHPATLSPYDVLNYYWESESSVSGFKGTMILKYNPADVVGTESNYVAARLIIPPGDEWSKAFTGPTTDNVNETTHAITFDFPAGTSNLGGNYTAGEDASIPVKIPVYTSNVVSGNWDDTTSWTPIAPAGGPNGFIVIIKSGNTIYTNGNKRFAYKTTINGTLDVGTTYGHNLGTIDGAGTLKLSTPILPAGKFTNFLYCGGGTLEYSGTSDYAIIADRLDTLHNLFFTGTGKRILPDKDLVICNQLLINGPVVIDSIYNHKLSIGGSFDLTSGRFVSGTGSNATVTFNGTSPQFIAGFNSSTQSPLNNFEISNAQGITLNSPIEMNGDLLLTNGLITTTTANLLKMVNQSSSSVVVPDSGSMNSYVNGPMSKYIFGGHDFAFPTGKGTRWGKFRLLNVSTGTWKAEYFNTGFSTSAVNAPLIQVSSTEYWQIASPANGQTAKVQLRWDSQSDINPSTTTGGINDIKVAEYNGTKWNEKPSDPPSGTSSDGIVQTSATIPINNGSDPQFYTLGSESKVKPTIILGTSPQVCQGSTTAQLPYASTTGSPNQYSIAWDGTAKGQGFQDVSWTALPVSPINLTIPGTAVAGTYNGTIQVKDATGNTSIGYAFTVKLTTVPTVNAVANQAYCNGVLAPATTLTGPVAGTTFTWTNNNTSVGLSASGSGNPPSFTAANSTALPVTATVTITPTASGCVGTTSSYTITVNPTPAITLGAVQPVCKGANTTNMLYSATSGSPDQFSIVYDATAQAQGFSNVVNTILPASPVPLSVPAAAAVGTYNGSLTVTNSSTGCISGTYPISITINALPTPVISGLSTVCANTSGVSYSTAAGMTNYQWTVTGGTIASGGTINDNTVTINWGGSGTGHVTLNYTNANGCVAVTPTDLSVTINALPSPTAGNNGPVCVGTTLSLTGGPNGMSTYAWTGPNGYTSASQSPTVSTSATTAMSGTYTLTVTDGNGCQNTATTTATVNALPTPTASNNGPVCSGTTLSLTGGPNGMTTYSWTGPNGYTSASQSPTVSTSATTAMSGTYTLTVTDGNGCQNTATTTATVNALPTPTAGNNGPVCAGTTLSLTGGPNGMSTYAWTGPNGYTSASQSPTVSTTATTAMSGTYTLTVTDGNGCQNTATTTATVNALPSPTASNNGPVCAGTTLSLTGGPNGMTTYAWTGPNGYTSASQSPTVSTSATTAMSGTYTLTVTDGNGCQNTATTTATVNALPTPTASNNGPVCAGTTLSLTGGPNGMSTYAWTGPNGYTSASQSPTVSTSATTAMSGTYTLTVTDGNGCQNTATTTATVNALPTPTAGNNGPVCAGTTLSLTGGPNGMSTYAWTGPNGYTSASQSPTVSTSATTAMSGTYTLTVTDGNGCQNTATTTATVNALPTPTAGNNGPVCSGTTLSLTGGPNGMTTYSWTGPNGYTSASQSPTVSTSATTAMSGTYTLTVTDGNGCQNTAATTATVNALPTPTAGNNGPVCAGTTLSLTGGPNGMSTYAWTGPNGYTSASQSPTVSTSATTAMSGTYTLTVTDGNGCQNTATTTATVNALPTPTAGNNGPVCAGTTLSLTGGPNGMSTYAWTGPNGYTSASQSPTVSTSATTAMSGTYTLTVTDGNGCQNTATTTATVNALPTPTAGNNGPVCAGTTLSLTGGPNGMSTYAWTGPNGYTSASQSPTVSTTATTAMSGTYTLTVTDGNGCQNTATTTATVNALPTITASAGASDVCFNASAQNSALAYTAVTNAPTDYAISWNTSALAAGLVNTGSSAITASPLTVPVAAGVVAGTYTGTIFVTNANGCTSAGSGFTLTINALPTPTFTTQPGASICVQTDATYTTQAGQSNYTWNVPGVQGTDYAIISGGTGTGSNTVTLQWLTTGVKTVTINYSNAAGCSAATLVSSVPTTANPLPDSGPMYRIPNK